MVPKIGFVPKRSGKKKKKQALAFHIESKNSVENGIQKTRKKKGKVVGSTDRLVTISDKQNLHFTNAVISESVEDGIQKTRKKKKKQVLAFHTEGKNPVEDDIPKTKKKKVKDVAQEIACDQADYYWRGDEEAPNPPPDNATDPEVMFSVGEKWKKRFSKATDLQQNHSDHRQQSSQNSAPRKFFPPPTTQKFFFQQPPPAKKDFQKNHSDNRQQSSQNSAPRKFFAPSTSQLLRNTDGPEPCRHFLSPGGCRFGKFCKFSHTGEKPFTRTHTGEKPFVRTRIEEKPFMRTHTGEKPYQRSHIGEKPYMRTHTSEKLKNDEKKEESGKQKIFEFYNCTVHC